MAYLCRLYLRLIGAQIRSEMQYRFSFMMQTLGQFLVTFLDFLALVVLMTRFQRIGSWTLAQVTLLYSTSAISFGLADVLAGDFDDFDRIVIRGEFDRVLLRPLGTVFQVAANGFHLRRIGRLSQGLLTLALAVALLHPAWGLAQGLFLLVTLLGGALLFGGILVTGAATAFWAPQTGEVVNIFTYGGQFMTSYPMSIYQDWLRGLFTYVIPMAFINYYPALYLLGKPDPFGAPAWLPFLAPLVEAVVFVLSLAFWHLGTRRYQSTGS